MKLLRTEDTMGIADHVRDNMAHARWVFGALAIILAPLVVLKVGGWLFDRREKRRVPRPPRDYVVGGQGDPFRLY